MEREQIAERTKLSAQISMLLNLRNAVQNAKSILPNVKNKLSEFGSLITNLQYFVTDYITEIDEFEHHFY